MEYIGEPTKQELREMLATKDLMSNGVKAGLTNEEFAKKRYKKIDQLMKNQIP